MKDFDQLMADLRAERARLELLVRSSHLPMEELPTVADAINRVDHALQGIVAIRSAFVEATIESQAELTKVRNVGTHLVGWSELADGWICLRCTRWRSEPALFQQADACVEG